MNPLSDQWIHTHTVHYSSDYDHDLPPIQRCEKTHFHSETALTDDTTTGDQEFIHFQGKEIYYIHFQGKEILYYIQY